MSATTNDTSIYSDVVKTAATAKTVSQGAAALVVPALVIPVVGVFVSGALAIVAGAGSLFTSDPERKMPLWEEANAMSRPVARDLTDKIVAAFSQPEVQQVVDHYSQMEISYIEQSAHGSEKTDATYVASIQNDALRCSSSDKYTAPPACNLFYLIWLHAMWSYGNFARDDIKSGFAASEFYKQLQVTLFPVLQNVDPSVVLPNVISQTNVDKPIGADAGQATVNTGTVTEPNTASVFSNVWVALAFAAAFIVALIGFGGKKK